MRLYIARDKRHEDRYDVGSVLCLSLVRQLPAVQVEEVNRRTAPRWLTGTPTLEVDGEVLRGHAALAHLQHAALAQAYARGEAAHAAATPQRPSARRALAPMPPPMKMSAPTTQTPDATPTTDAVADATPDAADGVFAESMWASHIDEAVEEEEDESTRKLTSDDLARALNSRQGVS